MAEEDGRKVELKPEPLAVTLIVEKDVMLVTSSVLATGAISVAVLSMTASEVVVGIG